METIKIKPQNIVKFYLLGIIFIPFIFQLIDLQDDKRTELKSKSITELESVQNNVRLLNEMLDSYKIGISSTEELELINELYQNCQRIKTPSIDKFMKELGWVESQESKGSGELPEGMLSKSKKLFSY